MADHDHVKNEERSAVDGLLRELARAGEGDDEVFVERVMDQLPGQPTGKVIPIEPSWNWYGGRAFWKFAAAFLICLFSFGAIKSGFVYTAQADTTEVFLFGQPELTPGQASAFRVYVQDGSQDKPIAGASVSLALKAEEGPAIPLGKFKTDANGFAIAQTQIPDDLAEGDYEVMVKAKAKKSGKGELIHPVTVIRTFRTMLSTDKPIYQPGQTIHMRALSLASSNLKPAQDRRVVFEVQDAKGNKVFKQIEQTTEFGIAAADFPLADQVNLGDYTVRVTVDDTVSERNVKVERYVLPKYSVQVSLDKPYYAPGDKLTADLKAVYTYGEPVAGAKVAIKADAFIHRFKNFAEVSGVTDATGVFQFELPLADYFVGQDLKKGDAIVRLMASIEDAAGQTQAKQTEVTVTDRPIRIEVFPESGKLVQGVENTVYVLTAYPDGRPAKTKIRFGDQNEVETSEMGIAKIKIAPADKQVQLTLRAEDDQGLHATVVRKLRIDDRKQDFLVRSDRAVYRQGETVQVEVLSRTETGLVFLDVVKDRKTYMMQTVSVADFRGQLAMDLPLDVAGTLELHAYRVLPDGQIVRDSKLIQVNQANSLEVTAELDKESYRPAEKAVVNFIVKSRDGNPTQAALSLAAVDEAVFALNDMSPGLESLYFLLQEELLEPKVQIDVRPPVRLNDIVKNPDPEPEPDWREAEVILFSGTSGPSQPDRSEGVTFEERADEVSWRKEAYTLSLLSQGTLVAYFFFLFSMIVVFGFGIAKVRKRVQLTDLPEVDKLLFRVRANGLCVALFFAPLIPIFVAVLLDGVIRDPAFGLSVIGLVALCVSGWLLFLALRLAHCEAARRLPLLRKVALSAPAAFLFGELTLVGALWGISVGGGFPSERGGAVMMLSLGVLYLLVPAMIHLGKVSALKPTGVGRVFGSIALFQSPWALGLLILPMFFTASQKMDLSMPMDSAAGAEWDTAEMPMPGAVAPTAPPTPMPPPMNGEPGEVAQAPVRVRQHFPETLLWQPQLITDEQGRASLDVALADSITTWRLSGSAVSAAGDLGSLQTGIRVFQDFFIDIDFPVALTQNDEISVPVVAFNYLAESQAVTLEVQDEDWFELLDESVRELQIDARGATRELFRIRVKTPGRHALTVKAAGSAMSDAVRRSVRVEPDGREVVETINGWLSANEVQTIQIPENAIAGASDLYVKVYPGAFSQVMEGLDNIFRMPHGCFEQTSSTTYPNVLVLDYLRRTKQTKPEIEMKAVNYINLGYQRLLTFEVSGGGFDWYGRPPANTVLTAYGLMEFHDMSKVHDVDPNLIKRTRKWLLENQEANGSWKPTGRLGKEVLTTSAYIAWAIAQTGDESDRLGKALDFISGEVEKTEDAYAIALCANALLAGGRGAPARALLDRLHEERTVEDKLAHWKGTRGGVFYAKGLTLDVETTALVAYAMLKADVHVDAANAALTWLVEKKDDFGTWHSTQATVLAMRALLEGTGGSAKDTRLDVTITANGALVKDLEITPDNSDVFHLVSLREQLRAGANQVALEASGDGDLAYQIVARHYLPWDDLPTPDKVSPLQIDVGYDTTQLKPQDILTATVTLRYNMDFPADMTLVDLGIPPGFDLQTDAFETLQAKQVIERFSVTGRQVTLYFRELPGQKDLVFSYRLKAKYPLRAKTPVTTAYQYYEPEVRAQAEPVELEVE